MSKQIGLPVYKATYDLFIFSFRIIKDMEKDYKYTVGEKLKNEIMDLLMNIYRANKTKDRITDHRIKKSWHGVEEILKGGMDPLIKSYREYFFNNEESKEE